MSIGKNSIARAAVANSATPKTTAQNFKKDNIQIKSFKTDEIKVLNTADSYAETDLEPLKKSIEKKGVLLPLLVAVTPENNVWLIDGYRRYYAAKSLDIKQIDAVVAAVKNKNEVNRLYKEIKSAKQNKKPDDIREEKFKVLAVVDHDLPAYLL